MLTQVLSQVYELTMGESEKRLYVALQRMLSTSAVDEKLDELMSLTKSYHNYKWEYVRHLGFNPDNENLSKCF